jgi:hypothetical protein
LPLTKITPQWEDLFVPGNFGHHSRSAGRYKIVLGARNTIFGEHHLMTKWSTTCFGESQRLLKLKYPMLLFDEPDSRKKR